jgi:hypothetical protein
VGFRQHLRRQINPRHLEKRGIIGQRKPCAYPNFNDFTTPMMIDLLDDFADSQKR